MDGEDGVAELRSCMNHFVAEHSEYTFGNIGKIDTIDFNGPTAKK